MTLQFLIQAQILSTWVLISFEITYLQCFLFDNNTNIFIKYQSKLAYLINKSIRNSSFRNKYVSIRSHSRRRGTSVWLSARQVVGLIATRGNELFTTFMLSTEMICHSRCKASKVRRWGEQSVLPLLFSLPNLLSAGYSVKIKIKTYFK